MRKSALLLVGVLAIFIFIGVMMMQSLVIVQRIASVSEVAGQVYVKARGDADFKPLGDKQHVLAGYTVRTGPGSGVTLNWVNGSRVRLGPETSVRVRKCTLNTSTRATTSLFDLDVGRIWVRVLTILGGRSKFEIRTPTATAGVRGTVFFVEVDESGVTRVAVHEGEVAIVGQVGAASVGAGQEVTAIGGEPSVTDRPQEVLDWEEQTGIIGPRLDLDVGPEVAPPAGADVLTVTGVSEPGATVTINGSRVELDRSNHFTAEVPVDRGDQGIILVSASDNRGGTTVRAIAIVETQ